MMDGAGRVQRLRHLTLPLLSPTSFFVIVTSVISALQTFGEVYVLSGPLDSTLTIMGYITRELSPASPWDTPRPCPRFSSW